MADRTKKTSSADAHGVTHTEDLYALPLGEFTAARDRLAKALKDGGDKEGAAAVKALKKPSTAAWTVNQLARRYPARVDAFLKAADRLRAAQRGALGPKGAQELRETSRTQRELVLELLQTASKVLSEAGFRAKGNHIDGVRDTLQAAPSASDEERRRLRRGVLTEELHPADITDVLGMMKGGARGGLRALPEPDPKEEPAPEPELPEEAEEEEDEAEEEGEAEEADEADEAEEAVPESTQRPLTRRPPAGARPKRRSAARPKADQAAKKAAHEQRRQVQAERARRAAAKRARDKASREAQKEARLAARAAMDAARESHAAEKAEEAARKARERAEKAERVAKEALERAATAEREAKEAQSRAAAAARRLEKAEEDVEER